MAHRFARWSRNALLVAVAGGVIAAGGGIAGVELQIHSASPDCIGRDQAIAQLLDKHPEERAYVEGQHDGLEGACGSVRSFVEHLHVQTSAP